MRERAVRMVFEHEDAHDSQWAAIQSIAAKIGCSGETLRNWVRHGQSGNGRRRVLAPILQKWGGEMVRGTDELEAEEG